MNAEIARIRRQKEEAFNRANPAELGRDAPTVYRDRRGIILTQRPLAVNFSFLSNLFLGSKGASWTCYRR